MQQLGKNKGFKILMTESKRIRRCRDHEGGSSYPGDRISLLPDDIIILILSFLSLKEVAVTSLLSRRWRHMWAFTKRLDFVVKDWKRKSLSYNMKRSKRFVKEVNQVLRLHKGSALEEFKLSFSLNENFTQEIDKWLKFASAKRVQRLELDFFGQMFHESDHFIEDYKLSYGAMNQTNGTSSKTMSSSLCRIKCCKFAGFESLKVLCLRSVNVTGEILEGFLSCCPSLEKLSVQFSEGLVHLKVQGPSLVLKCLEIISCRNLSGVEICNVNLVTLVYEGDAISWVLHDAPALVNLTVGGLICKPLSKLWLTQLSRCLSQLETLKIERSHLQVAEVFDVPFEFSNLKKLVLTLFTDDDYSLLGYTPLIKASPNLQRFVLECVWGDPTVEKRKIKRVEEKHHHQHIEEVEFRGYYGNSSHLELLMFFLDNAVSLKKIIVDPDFVFSLSPFMERSECEDLIAKVEPARRRATKQLKWRMIKRKMQQGVEIKLLK